MNFDKPVLIKVIDFDCPENAYWLEELHKEFSFPFEQYTETDEDHPNDNAYMYLSLKEKNGGTSQYHIGWFKYEEVLPEIPAYIITG